MFTYQLEPELSVAEFIDILVRSTLAERRPFHDLTIMQGMLTHADILLTCRCDDQLIGISRAITDFHFCTYLSDLAVDTAFQRRGIGKELIRRTHETAGLHTMLILLSAPLATAYYPHIGMNKHDSCWFLSRS